MLKHKVARALMTHFDYFIGEDVDDLCETLSGLRWREVASLEVCVSVKMIARLCGAQEPVDGFQSLMRLCLFIMDPKWRRVCNKNIKGTPVIDPV